MFSPMCSRCGQAIEIRIKNGGFEVGYSYFGGSMHFEAMRMVRSAGLKITPGDLDDLEVSLKGRVWHFGIRHSTTSRFIVFHQAFAAGKQVADLDFAQWDVTLTGIERQGDRLEYHPGTVVEAEDFLYLKGAAPALTRACHYINDGLGRRNVT